MKRHVSIPASLFCRAGVFALRLDQQIKRPANDRDCRRALCPAVSTDRRVAGEVVAVVVFGADCCRVGFCPSYPLAHLRGLDAVEDSETDANTEVSQAGGIQVQTPKAWAAGGKRYTPLGQRLQRALVAALGVEYFGRAPAWARAWARVELDQS